MSEGGQYEIVVGLEVHAQLLTKSKLFCGDSTAFGSEPNTQISPITLAYPGTLPKMNKKAIEFAIKMGLACECEIENHNYFARKHYFYPDLPKGYQISQHTTPICKKGFVRINTVAGEKNIRLNRIHLEEDAGKSLHDADHESTSVDYNRAGMPLIEIVSEPDIRSSEEAYAYVTELRKLVRYLDICDGNMEEGSFRCDANISVREKGNENLGTKVEVKNLNSIRHIKKAIDFEAARLIKLLQTKQQIIQQTRSFDATTGTTFSIRDKEDADDYRYFAEPDLTPFALEDEFIEQVRRSIPVLQKERIKNYIKNFHLSEYDATVLTEEKSFSDYFETIIHHFFLPLEAEQNIVKYKAAANWMLGPVKSWLNEHNKDTVDFPVHPSKIALIIELINDGKLNFSIASTRLWNTLLNDPSKDPGKIAVDENLIQQSDINSIEEVIDQVLSKYTAKVIEYKKGKKGLLGLFVGEVMKLSKGKADPKLTNDLLIEKLKSK